MTVKNSAKGSVSPHIGVITVSDSKAASIEEGRDEDRSGKTIQRRLKKEGISSDRVIIPDEEDDIRRNLNELISDPKVDAVITTGGTGITSRDKTVDVIREFFDKEISGFGEVLRRRSFEEIGGPAILTRSTAGIARQKPIFCLPGSPSSVKIGMNIIAPNLDQVFKYLRE